MEDPFAYLDLEQIQEAERKHQAAHPVLWWVAESIVFVSNPRKWGRGGVWEAGDWV